MSIIQTSDCVNRLPLYAVAAIAQRKQELLRAGVDVIDLGAGDPDIPPPDIAVEALLKAVRNPANSRYAFQAGSMRLRESIVAYMARRFGTTVDPVHEVLPLIGSKEGLAHLAIALLNRNDVCIVPEPGYPAYLGGALIAGADIEVVPLRADAGFLVELQDLPPSRLEKTRLVYLNYPNNPTGAVAPLDYLRRTVEICHRYGIVLAYDNPYVEMGFDGYLAPSIFEIEGAKDIAVEFHSFSKTFCMTGWRLGSAVGNSSVIKALSKVKSYVDTGAFLGIQEAGASVLDRVDELAASNREAMVVRRDALIGALKDAGQTCPTPLAGMYLWLALPPGVESGRFARELLDEQGLALLAGSAFGAAGEGFVRLSFIVGPDRLREAAMRLGPALSRASGVLS